jgi:hypothetical protein
MLTEQRIVKQITTLPSQNAINVQWANQILRDGVFVSETYERKAYTEDQVADFSTEVTGASNYVAAMGW